MARQPLTRRQRRRVLTLYRSGHDEPMVARLTGIDLWTVRTIVQSSSGANCEPTRCPECGALVTYVIGGICMACEMESK